MKIQIGNTMGYYTAELEEPTLTIGMDYFGSDWFPAIDVWCEESFGPEDRWGGSTHIWLETYAVYILFC